MVTNNSFTKPDVGDEKTASLEQLVYRFGITSMLEKKEALQEGDKVRLFVFFFYGKSSAALK